MLRVQWNSTFWLHRPDTNHLTLGYCSCKHDTKEQYWGQELCQMERNISVRPTEMTRPVKEDHLQSWSWIFRSDQTKMVRSIWCSNGNYQNFGLNGKCPLLTAFQSILTVWLTFSMGGRKFQTALENVRMDGLDFQTVCLTGWLNDIKGLHDQSFKQLLFGYFAAINLSSCLHHIMHMITENAFQSKQSKAVCIAFISA